MLLVIWLFIYVGVVLYELLPIFHRKEWKIFWFYTTALAISGVLNILIALNFKLPSPANGIKNIVIYVLSLKE